MNNDILEAIEGERQYQIRRFGEVKHDIPGWVLIIKKQLDTAVMHWLDGDSGKALAEIVQSTAVGVACLEQHGVPKAAYRATVEEILGIPTEVERPALEEEAAESPETLHEITVKNWEHMKTYQLGQGYICIRISELEDVKEQYALKKFMHGQTQPMSGDFVYLHDYENFLAKGTLFWD